MSTGQLYPIATQQNGLQAAAAAEETMLDLKTMVENDTAIIANSSSTMAQKFTAFQELSGWTNGTDPKWSVLDDSYFATQKATLSANLQTCLQKFNDVEIPVGGGNTARVYNADGSPATAADLLNAWTKTNTSGADGCSGGVNFTFSYDVDCDNNTSFTHDDAGKDTPPWSNNQDNNYMGGLSSCNDPSTNTNSDPSKDINVDPSQSACSNDTTFNCKGDAQAIAGYCSYQHMDANGNDVAYNYQSEFTGANGILTASGWSS